MLASILILLQSPVRVPPRCQLLRASSTPSGTYPITVTGTSGTLSHSTTATLVVVAAQDFSISASPPSQTVKQGKSTSYTVTVAPSGGFASTVSLSASVSVSPAAASGPTVSFSPQKISGGSGKSTMTVTTGKSTPTQNYTITITGTGGSVQHSTSVSLTVQ